MRFVLRRVILSVVTLFVIASATFFLMHSIPGGPFSRERALPREIEANLARKYNLDEPVLKQFARYIASALRGDLGPSFLHEGRTTNDIIREGFPKSAVLGIAGFLIALAVGLPMGILAALRRHRMVDRGLMLLGVLGVSVPSFILASLLQYFFSYRLKWAPAAGWGESPWQVILPALALAGFPVAFISRLVRTSMLNVLDADWLRTAKAKGLGRAMVIMRHALRNAILPVVTYSGPLLASLLTGSFVVENIFAIPGLGSSFVLSIQDRDYTVIMGVTLFYSALLIGFNVLVDAMYAWLDPRISLEAPTN
ncbi:MAG: ABC transporter permease [Candidatus Sumerlaeaceae bacterium]